MTYPFAILLLICLVIIVISRHRASRSGKPVPGPRLARWTPLWLWYHCWAGDQATATEYLHARYGPVVRIAPSHVDIADGAAIHAIYLEKGGFPKHESYTNSFIDGGPTLFSDLDAEHRKPRAKAVVGMFANARLHGHGARLVASADRLVARVKTDLVSGRVDILNLSRGYALDISTEYLFGRSFGALEEKGKKISASTAVDFGVDMGRFWYCPPALYDLIDAACDFFYVGQGCKASRARNRAYVEDLVPSEGHGSTKLDQTTDTYQHRLLQVGCSVREVKRHCHGLIFAATDSTGISLATICWHLCHDPSIHKRLQEEIQATHLSTEEVNVAKVQGLPYLRGVVLEGLRISRANPIQFPRVVPSPGWAWRGYDFAPGTTIGVGAYQLHWNETTFAQPDQFLPERWLDATPEMSRDHGAFGFGARQSTPPAAVSIPRRGACHRCQR